LAPPAGKALPGANAEAVDSLPTLVHSRSAPAGNGRFTRREQRPLIEPGDLLLDRYRPLEILGRGGFAVVWRAQDELLGREVALKRIALPAEGNFGRATREAHASARLSHPSIVALYEAHSTEQEFFLASELVEGHTLKELISSDDLDDEEILEIAVALAEGLEHAHARGVIHRDVKPQNVLVPSSRREQAAKLADFGGASLIGEEALTLTGDVLGTLAYMAPEQSEGRQAGPETDLYSLALVIYEALSGMNPVRGATPAATIRRLGQPIESLGRHRPDLPGHLVSALDQALDPTPERRGTVPQLRETLELALVEPNRGIRGSREHVRHSVFGVSWRHQRREIDRWFELPRIAWWGCAIGLIVWQASSGRAGVALLLGAAAVPLSTFPRRASPGWLVSSLAAVLGLIGLAGAYPAISGQFWQWRKRAALGALGYWWLLLAEPLSHHTLWLGEHVDGPAMARWEESLHVSAAHVVYPLLNVGTLLGCLIWAVASVTLPWIVRGRGLAVDLLAAGGWAVSLAIVEQLLDRGPPAHLGQPSPHGLIGSAVLAAVLAVCAVAIRAPL
jgi:eukaryotic-like serine/threonine-protein kinase